MITPRRLGADVLSVRDIDASVAWYREKFGFEPICDDVPNSKSTAVGANDVVIYLNPLESPGSAAPVDTAGQLCVQLVCLEVDAADLDRVAEEFPEDADIVVLDEHPRYRSRIVEDPDGHAIELYAWREPGPSSVLG